MPREREVRTILKLVFFCLLTLCSVSRIALVKPERAREAEDIVLQAAQTGQIQGQVDEDRLKQLLEKLSENEGNKPKVTVRVITFQRQRVPDAIRCRYNGDVAWMTTKHHRRRLQDRSL